MELTNTRLGLRHSSGMLSAPGWAVRAKPGPEVRGSPSFWYFAEPMALSRLAIVRA
jgi:hypothetical protein